ncbi:MAG: hypothetical protein N3E45_05510 [Oscillatoriaceae bacterium SKW80]|nr:hypothetical protein [Oscillatoriaceae bacterium SKYG93]MCX8120272.1 hypothetical protein [Oscillatoriaceae bacterium SKW80]MDW8453198.1 hypothetical protein [Oscillatoriaceae cyanobacterium SKYGB_i_bin93]HIK28890.1 hypothetical protein [Oscillatoriaceae cyanobacterium M7585_C2015_266]
MSARIIFIAPLLAAKTSTPKPKTAAPAATSAASTPTLVSSELIWMGVSGVLLLLLIGLAVYAKLQIDKISRKLRTEEFKNRDLQKKYKLAVETITKMEKNPDLIHSREFNLDYLRMRMAEETFHFCIVNQIKVKVKDKISVALRPTNETRGMGRQVDEIFDVEYEVGTADKVTKRVLFRIQIKLTKLPTQPTSVTISQIIDCIETYLSPSDDHDSWQPTIQGRIAYIHWDQKAKPTPLLVLEQSNEGVNVTFATKRKPASSSTALVNTPEQSTAMALPEQKNSIKRSSKTELPDNKNTGKNPSNSEKRSGKTGGIPPKTNKR